MASRVMHILLAYDSLSGNTREASRLVKQNLEASGHDVIEICVSANGDCGGVLERRHDLHILGTWTGGLGRTPAGMKAFLIKLSELDADLRPASVALFGTGETQWGMQYFCGALDRMARHFATDYPLLKLEQMPANESDREKIADWTKSIIRHYELKNERISS